MVSKILRPVWDQQPSHIQSNLNHIFVSILILIMMIILFISAVTFSFSSFLFPLKSVSCFAPHSVFSCQHKSVNRFIKKSYCNWTATKKMINMQHIIHATNATISQTLFFYTLFIVSCIFQLH